MPHDTPLHLYEELLLLALHDEKGTVEGGYIEQALAGALLAELLLEGFIETEEGVSKHVRLMEKEAPEDLLLKRAWSLIQRDVRQRSMDAWISEVAGIYDLHYLAARKLCERGIVENAEKTVLWIFHHKIYPTLDPAPEQEIIARLRTAIEDESTEVDPRTAALISLAHHTDYLRAVLRWEERNRYKHRIEAISKGETSGPAAKAVIDACQAAIVTSVMLTNMIMMQQTTFNN